MDFMFTLPFSIYVLKFNYVKGARILYHLDSREWTVQPVLVLVVLYYCGKQQKIVAIGDRLSQL
jgi:hypothetical protein